MRGSFSSKIHVCHVEQKVERFQKLVEAAFLSNNKDANSPLQRGGCRWNRTAPYREALGWATGDGGRALTGGCGSPNLGPLGSSSGTWNLAWNYGR